MTDRQYSAEQIGKNIRQLREGKGWSQDVFAEKMGATKSAVSFWERGETIPRMPKIERMAQLFGVTVTEILTEPRKGGTLTADEIALLGNYRKLNAEGKAMVMNAVRVMALSEEYREK